MLSLSLTKQVKRCYQPKRKDILRWVKYSLVKSYTNIHINCLIVTNFNSQQFNYQYRQKNYPTNVISLEYSDTRDKYAILTGELILCDAIIVQEAAQQNKTIMAYYAHMVIHGLLHLQGFDHQLVGEAQKMEKLETKIMQKLGFDNPYMI